MGVNLHVDLETLQLIQGPGQRSAVSSLRFKRGDAAKLQVVFLENGVTPATIGDPGALEIQIGIKPRNQFDRSYLAHSADWSMPSEGDDTPTYGCAISFNTLQLNSAFNIGSPTVEELPEVTLMGEITWREGEGEPTSTRTFLVVIENDVNRGDEGVPVSADPPYPLPQQLALLSQVIRHDVAQSLSPEQQEQVRANIGVASGIEVLAFATDTDKRKAAQLAPGTIAMITDEGGRIEQFLGEILPPDPDLQLVTIGSQQFFITRLSETVFVAMDGGGSNAVFYVNGGSWAAQGEWIPDGTQQAAGAVASPALADWSATAIESVAYVGAESVQGNWNVLRNTVYLLVNYYGSESITVNGITVTDGAYIGWVDPARVSVESTGSYTVSEISSYADNAAFSYTLFFAPNVVLALNGGSGFLPLPIQTCPRGTVILSVL